MIDFSQPPLQVRTYSLCGGGPVASGKTGLLLAVCGTVWVAGLQLPTGSV